MGQHLLLEEDPLVPGMPPMATRVLGVGVDATRLDLMVKNLRLRGYYQVTSSNDPAAAVAWLRQGGQQVSSFDLVMVDTHSNYSGGGGVLELVEFAAGEPRLCVYAVPEKGEPIGPLDMKDLDIAKKPIHTVASNGQKSRQDNPNGSSNTSSSTTTSTITNSQSLGRRARREQPARRPKRPRVVWTDELHNEFLEAHDKLLTAGEDCVPKKILHLMDDPTLTRENVASHLQKHKFNLLRATRTNPFRRSQSRTKHRRSTPRASFASPNTPSQQQAPPTVMQPDLSATVYINYGTNAHATLEASTTSGMQDSRLMIHMKTFMATDKSNKSVPVDVALKDMHLGADDPKQNSYVGNSDDNNLQEDISDILNNEPKPSWENEFLFSSGD